MYEVLKRFFQFKNEKYEVLNTAMIGALTTFAHDFFITPSDSKPKQLIGASDQAAATALLPPHGGPVCENDRQGRGHSGPVQVLPCHRHDEHTFRHDRGLRE